MKTNLYVALGDGVGKKVKIQSKSIPGISTIA
jgi:hypothetical protein